MIKRRNDELELFFKSDYNVDRKLKLELWKGALYEKYICFIDACLFVDCVSADKDFYGTWVIDKPFHIKGILGDVDEVYESIKGITITYTEDKFILKFKNHL